MTVKYVITENKAIHVIMMLTGNTFTCSQVYILLWILFLNYDCYTADITWCHNPETGLTIAMKT